MTFSKKHAAVRFYAGVFVVAACTLMLQVVQTRILSVMAWYHLAFFAISMAMFGLTAGAVWIYLRRSRFTQRTLSYDLSHYGAAFAITIALSLLMQMTLSPILVSSLSAVWTWLELALSIAVPFFFSGVVLSLALTRSPFPIGRVYGVDMLGAASGCLGVLLLLNITDGPSAILWIAAIAAVGAILFNDAAIGDAPQVKAPLDRLFRRRTLILGVLSLCAVFNGMTYYGVQPLMVKGTTEDGNSHVFRKWNTFSRIAVYPTTTSVPALWGPSPVFSPAGKTVTQRWLNIDGDAGTVAYRFGGDLQELAFLRYDVTTLGYYLPGRSRSAVIGIGGGRDIFSAQLFGRTDVTGVELNPIFVRLLSSTPGFADFTNLGLLKGVKLVNDEGRSWFARTGDTFDFIQMSLIDTWAATGAGAFSLSENGLYTVEAWKIFMSRLNPSGVFSVSRWYDARNPSETGRLLSLAVATLIDMGATDPERHIFLAASGKIATLILARDAFSSGDIDALQRAASELQYRVLVTPSAPPDSETLRAIVRAKGRDALLDATAHDELDLTPATDDRPFFFNQVPMNNPVRALAIAKGLIGAGGVGGVKAGNLVATATLLVLLVISFALVCASIVIPLRSAVKDVGRRLVAGSTAYFVLIGIGFMTVEIGLLQRMSVFLGHPVYSLSITLFTLILTTGVGSLLSDGLVLNSRRKLLGWSAATSLYIFSLPFWLHDVLLTMNTGTLWVRAAVCVGVIAPAGLLMGFGFPTGMRLVEATDSRPTPWLWGVNGATGVLASVLAIVTSIALGIGATLAIGAGCYLLLIPAAFSMLAAPLDKRVGVSAAA
ncbi:MAG: hypothetical protein C5B46_09210 [Proteobacteria bacterium]|nr:MAG: hypothetical protein C5B46_09210 [Pseudomonadota bacterium]